MVIKIHTDDSSVARGVEYDNFRAKLGPIYLKHT